MTVSPAGKGDLINRIDASRQRKMGGKSYWLFVIGYWGRRSRFLKERGHLAHLFNSGRAMRPRGADSFRKDLPQCSVSISEHQN
jgi:hypothetical protein